MHPYLKRQIQKYLGDRTSDDLQWDAFVKAVSDSYYNYERDKELSDHAFTVNEQEYIVLNKQLQALAQNQEAEIQSRTRELQEMAQLPMVNPNPIFRTRTTGDILLRNPAANQINYIEWEGKKYRTRAFFKKLAPTIRQDGMMDIHSNQRNFQLFFKYIPESSCINFYGADVTEKNHLRIQSQDNLTRIRSILENTNDAYYIIYSTHREKSLLTARWRDFFGFDLSETNHLFKEKSKCIKSEPAAKHLKIIEQLKVGDQIALQYQVQHKKSGQQFWLSEVMTKRYDLELDDIVISGRITDITREQQIVQQIQESEQRFRNLIEAVPVMVWVSNEENKVTYSNRAMRDFLGYRLEDLRDYKDYMRLVHPDDRKKAVFEWSKNIRKKKIIQTEYRLQDVAAEYHHISETAVPRFYEDGKFAGYIGAHFDLTTEKKYQQTISLEKEKLEILTNNSPDVIFLLNSKGVIEYVSPTVQRVLGYTDKQLAGTNFSKYMCDACREQLSKMKWLQTLKKSQNQFEFRMQTKAGKLIWMESSLRPVVDNGVSKILMYNRNINQAKISEFALRESEQKYRGLFENMKLGVLEVDLQERIQWANTSFENILGYSLKSIKGKTASSLFLTDTESRQTMQRVKRTRTDKRETIYEIQMKRKDGDLRDIVISGSPIIDFEGNVKGSVGIHWDVTEIRKMERMIEDEKNTRQRAIMKATIRTEEQQRALIGHELHDEVGHVLTYTSLFLQMLTQYESVRPEQINKAHGQVEIALQELKRISRNLVPPALVDLGLKEAVIELFNQYSELRGLKFDIRCHPTEFLSISMDAKKNLYRMIQELVSNTHKHAKATQVRLTIRKWKDQLQLEYFNDGKTFRPSRIKHGAGFESIQNRVYFYNGTFTISSNQQTGNRFVIELPLKNIQ